MSTVSFPFRGALALVFAVGASLASLHAADPAPTPAPGTRSHDDVDPKSPEAVTRKRLPGKHALTLQWIVGRVGRVEVTAKDGKLLLQGAQRGEGTDMVEVQGEIVEVLANGFKLKGKITTRVSHIAAGVAVEREGTFTFLSTKGRKYWRLQEMENPKDPPTVDYVDIYFSPTGG